jgi:hypothetical protein
MKLPTLLFIVTLLLLPAAVLVDQLYVKNLKMDFLQLEKERIETTNGLATAKIVHENLNHVRDMVFENMDFPNKRTPIDHEERVFDFITSCLNDLKLTLVSVKPLRPQVNGLVTTLGFDIEMTGDFFTFGELCAKFENSRRLFSLVSYKVSLNDKEETSSGSPRNKAIKVTMRVNTFRVRKV